MISNPNWRLTPAKSAKDKYQRHFLEIPPQNKSNAKILRRQKTKSEDATLSLYSPSTSDLQGLLRAKNQSRAYDSEITSIKWVCDAILHSGDSQS